MPIRPEEVAVGLNPEHVQFVDDFIVDTLSDASKCMAALRNPSSTVRYYEIRVPKRISYITADEIIRQYEEAGWQCQISGRERDRRPLDDGNDPYELCVQLYPPMPALIR